MMTGRKRLLGLAVLSALAMTVWVAARAGQAPATGKENIDGSAPVLTAPKGREWVAAPGRIEPVSEEIKLGFGMAGTIEAVLAEEGDTVARGQLLAVLKAPEFTDRVAEAEAALEARRAELALLESGARVEERREAEARHKEAEAELAVARAEHERRKRLLAEEVVSREEADRAERAFRVAVEREDQARQRLLVARNQSRPEELTRARAAMAEAEARLAEMRSLLEKTYVRSPINGVVLRKHRRAGETVSESFDTPVATVGDVSVLNVRADVDENDVALVRVGQEAYVTAPAFGEKRFRGRVSRVARILGKKNIRTDEPAERVDKKVLETLIALDPAEGLFTGLRVDTYILVDGAGGAR